MIRKVKVDEETLKNLPYDPKGNLAIATDVEGALELAKRTYIKQVAKELETDAHPNLPLTHQLGIHLWSLLPPSERLLLANSLTVGLREKARNPELDEKKS